MIPKKVTFQLNSFAAKWMAQQREFCKLEWIARNSDRIIDQENVAAVLREALDEFISRHKDEFL